MTAFVTDCQIGVIMCCIIFTDFSLFILYLIMIILLRNIVLNVPNELILYFYLEENGFKIVDERLLGSKKVYYVVRT